MSVSTILSLFSCGIFRDDELLEAYSDVCHRLVLHNEVVNTEDEDIFKRFIEKVTEIMNAKVLSELALLNPRSNQQPSTSGLNRTNTLVGQGLTPDNSHLTSYSSRPSTSRVTQSDIFVGEGKKIWSFQELEKMDALQLIDEIPSDTGSVTSDCASESDEELNSNVLVNLTIEREDGVQQNGNNEIESEWERVARDQERNVTGHLNNVNVEIKRGDDELSADSDQDDIKVDNAKYEEKEIRHTGAEVSLISHDWVQRHINHFKNKLIKVKNVNLVTANSKKISIVSAIVTEKLKIGNSEIEHGLLVMKDMRFDGLLGMDVLGKLKLKLDLKDDKIFVDNEEVKWEIDEEEHKENQPGIEVEKEKEISNFTLMQMMQEMFKQQENKLEKNKEELKSDMRKEIIESCKVVCKQLKAEMNEKCWETEMRVKSDQEN
ncbi:hypothetical protein RN001_003714 [Aquatica leii]|uniref:Uncharacterized protein n=1 Tax=Aquatica leii TaxID=1421715 RepID=A0AAN7SRP4_9COLE|nr:hypothetical protein RN001_003714 [Aquatica leii]